MKGTIETNAYLASVEYYDETLPQVEGKIGKIDTNGMEFVVLAKSYAEAESMIKETVTPELLVKIYGIEVMDAVPLF